MAVASAGAIAPPSDDKRWRVVDATMRRHGYAPSALIEALHSAQQSFGYLDEPTLRYVAASLHVPPSRVYGVATFYHFFSMKPQGEHTCVVCTGTACYIKGSGQMLSALGETFGVKPGETTEDGQLSVMIARCLGACSLAPAAVFDGEVVGKLTPETIVQRARSMNSHDA
ncbi:MAG: bidirectional hydrogenase complex protein HoxE [Chloroflexota bacterium]